MSSFAGKRRWPLYTSWQRELFMSVFLRLWDSNWNVNFRAVVAVTAPTVSNLSGSPGRAWGTQSTAEVRAQLSNVFFGVTLTQIYIRTEASVSAGRRLTPVYRQCQTLLSFPRHSGQRKALEGSNIPIITVLLAGNHSPWSESRKGPRETVNHLMPP